MNVLLVMPGEAPREVETDGLLASMQKLVGGTIQAIYPWADPVVLVANDDGKLMDLEVNRALRHEDTGEIYDIICGNFFICGIGKEDFTSLSPELMMKYQDLFYAPEMFMRTENHLVVLSL